MLFMCIYVCTAQIMGTAGTSRQRGFFISHLVKSCENEIHHIVELEVNNKEMKSNNISALCVLVVCPFYSQNTAKNGGRIVT